MTITLAASVNVGVYKVTDKAAGGKYWKTEYFYESLSSLKKEDGVIYACFDTYGAKEDKELFDKIEEEYGIK